MHSHFEYATHSFGMPSPNRPATDIINSDVQREQEFDAASLTTFVANNEQQMCIRDRNSQIARTRRLNRTAENQLTDNANIRDQVTNCLLYTSIESE